MISPDVRGNIKNPLDSFILNKDHNPYQSKESEKSVVIRTDSEMQKIGMGDQSSMSIDLNDTTLMNLTMMSGSA
jgi:hypothetical protein